QTLQIRDCLARGNANDVADRRHRALIYRIGPRCTVIPLGTVGAPYPTLPGKCEYAGPSGARPAEGVSPLGTVRQQAPQLQIGQVPPLAGLQAAERNG